jgi:hypothetical protein
MELRANLLVLVLATLLVAPKTASASNNKTNAGERKGKRKIAYVIYENMFLLPFGMSNDLFEVL